MSDLINEQSPPHPSAGDVWLMVLEDMEARRQMGLAKYGTPVQPFNGREPLVDAYQELLDLVVYLRQDVAEATALRIENAMLKRQCDGYTMNIKGTSDPIQFPAGTAVAKFGGDYTFAGVVVAAFYKSSGQARYVVENKQGLLHIFSGSQLTQVQEAMK